VQLVLAFDDHADPPAPMPGAQALGAGTAAPRAHTPDPPRATRATQATEATQPAQTTYYVRHPRARRYVLRVDPDGSLRVTIPRRGSKKEALAFAARHATWVARQRARLRTPLVSPEEQQRLKRRARQELPARLRALAAAHGLNVRRVTIRNQRSRWGSCGPDGHICLNWRLVLMPDGVRDYVLIHELMHLRRLDHSPAYWRLVAAACPDFRAARLWLRAHGPELR
jgi:predicted metal-dependent hydrolase